MKNRCILGQLGYQVNDQRVRIGSDDYLDADLDENLSVGANSDCSQIVVHTYNRDIVDIDMSDERIIITIPLSIDGGYEMKKEYDKYDSIIDLSQKGMEWRWRVRDSREEEQIKQLDPSACSVDAVLNCVITEIKYNEEVPEGVDLGQTADLMARAIRPMVADFISRSGAPKSENHTVRVREQKNHQ